MSHQINKVISNLKSRNQIDMQCLYEYASINTNLPKDANTNQVTNTNKPHNAQNDWYFPESTYVNTSIRTNSNQMLYNAAFMGAYYGAYYGAYAAFMNSQTMDVPMWNYDRPENMNK